MATDGRGAGGAPGATAATVLLDTGDTRHRLVQQLLPLAGVFLILAGLALSLRLDGLARVLGIACAVFGLALIVLVTRVLVRFDVRYRGHVLRFENSPVFGESLSIDGVRIRGGALGYRKTIRATIRSGDGAGDRIFATSEAGLLEFKCRIEVEPPREPREPDGVTTTRGV